MKRTSAFAICLATPLLSCSSKPTHQTVIAFGGEGAEVEGPDARPLTEEDERPRMVGPCATVPPPGTDALLDDFEDGDHKLFKGYHREGWWFTADDGTEGAAFTPKKGEFKATPLTEGEATDENEMALHLTAEGLKDWGVQWGTTLRWKNDGISCPFNASAFDGIQFRAKGPGTIRVKINTIDTSPPDNGGVCQEKCWDAHYKLFRMKDEWKTFTLRWTELQQDGWGTDARFDPERLLAVSFTASPDMLPVDFWVDDIRFLEKDAAKNGPREEK